MLVMEPGAGVDGRTLVIPCIGSPSNIQQAKMGNGPYTICLDSVACGDNAGLQHLTEHLFTYQYDKGKAHMH